MASWPTEKEVERINTVSGYSSKREDWGNHVGQAEGGDVKTILVNTKKGPICILPPALAGVTWPLRQPLESSLPFQQIQGKQYPVTPGSIFATPYKHWFLRTGIKRGEWKGDLLRMHTRFKQNCLRPIPIPKKKRYDLNWKAAIYKDIF